MCYALLLFGFSIFFSNVALVLLIGFSSGEDMAFPNAHIWDVIISLISCSAVICQSGALVLLTISIELLGSNEGVKETFSLKPFAYAAYTV